MINSKTSFLALIGNPISHSLSPIMHNAALKYLEINSVYLAFECKNDDFDSVMNGLRKINCKGVNITIPFKEKVFSLCKEITPTAKRIRAINTLKLNSKSEWSGTNTDIEGFLYPLRKYDLTQKKAIVLGSGGAARSAVQGLIDMRLSEVNIVSRNQASLDNLLRDFNNEETLRKFIHTDLEILNILNTADLIINTTPVGMKTKNENDLPFGDDFWQSINKELIVYDLIYNPKPTRLLRFCEKKGCETIDGSQMLIAQGVKSIEFWFEGIEVPFEVMQYALKDFL